MRGSSKDRAEWVYDPATERIKLKRSNKNDFVNLVAFSKEGRFINVNSIETFTSSHTSTLEPSSNILDYSNSFNVSHLNAKNIPSKIIRPYDYAYQSKYILDVDDEGVDRLGQYKYLANISAIAQTMPGSLKTPTTLGGITSEVVHRSSATLPTAFGAIGTVKINNGSANQVIGSQGVYIH